MVRAFEDTELRYSGLDVDSMRCGFSSQPALRPGFTNTIHRNQDEPTCSSYATRSALVSYFILKHLFETQSACRPRILSLFVGASSLQH